MRVRTQSGPGSYSSSFRVQTQLRASPHLHCSGELEYILQILEKMILQGFLSLRDFCFLGSSHKVNIA